MTFQTQTPAADKDMIPKPLLRAMLVLALCTVAIVGYARITGQEPAAQPVAGNILQERQIVLVGGGAKAVTVLDADGKVIRDLAHGGFITVIQNGLQTERKKQGVDQSLPVRLIRYDNNRLTLLDPATNWSVELQVFGSDNKAAFERLLTE